MSPVAGSLQRRGRGFVQAPSRKPDRPYDLSRPTITGRPPPMLVRTLALICASMLGLMAGASAQTPAAPPATTAPAGTPPAAMPPATAPPAAPTAAAPPAATAPATPPTRI